MGGRELGEERRILAAVGEFNRRGAAPAGGGACPAGAAAYPEMLQETRPYGRDADVEFARGDWPMRSQPLETDPKLSCGAYVWK